MAKASKLLFEPTDEEVLAKLSEGRAHIYGTYTGPKIEQLRKKLGLSVRDFAAWTGVCNSTIYAWEGGKKVIRPRRTPSHLAQRALYQLESFFFPTGNKKEIF